MEPRERDARIRQLEDGLLDVTRRLRALEDGRRAPVTSVHGAEPEAASPDTTRPLSPAAARDVSDLASLATLLGRTFIVLGGGFLLRALTESGRLPGAVGVGLGLLYSLIWLVMADRATASNRLGASFHGVTATLVALPLVWEATARFHLVSPAGGALMLASGGAGAFLVAWRGKLDAVAGTAAYGTLATALVTAYGADHWAAFAILLVLMSTATFWLSEMPRHAWLRWPPAITAGLAVAAVTSRALATPPGEAPGWALLAQGLLVAAMLGVIGIRTVVLGRDVRIFDVAQALSGLVIGIGGAALSARGSTAGLTLIGAVTAVLASGAYLAAFFRLADRPRLAASYHAFAAFGLVAAITALRLLFAGAALTVASLVLAVSTIVLGRRRLSGYAPLHGAAFVMNALTASGVLGASLAAWLVGPASWPPIPLVAWLSLVAAGACAMLTVRKRGEIGDLLATAGQVIIAAAFVIGAGGALVRLVGPAIAGPALASIDGGILASVRTVLLSLSAVALALAHRFQRTAVFARLVYPVLAVGGLRLLLDDFRHSQPSTLFLALAAYGAALVVAPKVLSSNVEVHRSTVT